MLQRINGRDDKAPEDRGSSSAAANEDDRLEELVLRFLRHQRNTSELGSPARHGSEEDEGCRVDAPGREHDVHVKAVTGARGGICIHRKLTCVTGPQSAHGVRDDHSQNGYPDEVQRRQRVSRLNPDNLNS